MTGDAMPSARDFGASGDGRTDDTAAFQRAIDAAVERKGTVFVPEGTYIVSSLRLRPQTGLAAHPGWSYRAFGGAVLRLADPGARCLLDLTGAMGVTLSGLCLDGGKREGGAHGVMFDKPDYGTEEDTPRIERCRIAGFGGDGVHLGRIWCFSIRHCMVAHNGGAGIRLRGWDGFILDNWLSGNRGAGFAAEDENAAVTMTANRIEWNAGGGIVVRGGKMYNITGNYVDRSGGVGIRLGARGERRCESVTVTGNVIYRSGKPDWRRLGEHEDSHALLEDAAGVVFSGNAMHVGRDDGGKGAWSPRFGIVLARLEDSVVKDNVLHCGALEQLVVDLGGHGRNVVMADNVGSPFAPPT